MRNEDEERSLRIWKQIFEEAGEGIPTPPNERNSNDGWSRLLQEVEDNETHFTYNCYYWVLYATMVINVFSLLYNNNRVLLILQTTTLQWWKVDA
ncbi:MAG: hypothetical protein EB127_30355 [Alphaproteobacteria bacterium]|nr:hypothetical protein [Alphaproteobacteria bacterium]